MKSREHTQAPPLRSNLRLPPSRTVAAGVLFTLLCVAAWSLNLGRLAPDDFPYPTWTSWAINGYMKDPAFVRPQLVFLGSSLFVTPMGAVDADFMGRNIDACHHHQSLFFEERFKQFSGSKIRTYNFALPGAMPSDAYLITDFLLKGERKPDVLVYGVAPRDFLENTLPDPTSTDPFRYLSKFGNYTCRNESSVWHPGWLSHINYSLARLCYPYGVKDDVQTAATRWFKDSLSTICATMDSTLPGELSVHQRKKVLPYYRPYEIREREAYFRPSTAEQIAAFNDNTGEYRVRYKHLKWDTFVTQMKFLADTLNIARERQIHAVVVAMPITAMNKQLISSTAWKAYNKSLRAFTRAKGATFIDLDETGTFKKSDFNDTVHLGPIGGKKLFEMLARELAGNQAVLKALGPRVRSNRQEVAGLEESSL